MKEFPIWIKGVALSDNNMPGVYSYVKAESKSEALQKYAAEINSIYNNSAKLVEYSTGFVLEDNSKVLYRIGTCLLEVL